MGQQPRGAGGEDDAGLPRLAGRRVLQWPDIASQGGSNGNINSRHILLTRFKTQSNELLLQCPPCCSNEAPILFSRRGWYYLLYGHTCCFCQPGSGARVQVSSHWRRAGHVTLQPPLIGAGGRPPPGPLDRPGAGHQPAGGRGRPAGARAQGGARSGQCSVRCEAGCRLRLFSRTCEIGSPPQMALGTGSLVSIG